MMPAYTQSDDLTDQPEITRWTALDETPSPSAFIEYLDAVSSLTAIQRIKQQTFDRLQAGVGDHLLDVGCGAGDDVRALAQRVGKTGRVVGFEVSATMIEEARRRSSGLNLPIEFCLGDADRLDFPNETFTGCRIDRVLVHLDDPLRTLSEMVRVLRPGGRLVAFDFDWETLIVDAPDHALTRRLLNFFCDHRHDQGTKSMPSPNAISIVSYDARYQSDFKRLNEAWIREYFEMEETDHKALDHPEQYIIASGGEILFAIERDTVVGTCALIRTDSGPFDFELAKMAVDPRFRGRGIGQQLGAAIIERARRLGAKTIFLESNTILAPAISLYRKLGFVETERQPTPYARGNIQMVLSLRSKDAE